MPGAGRSDSKALRYVGAAVFVVALVGGALFGWSFDSADGSIPLVVALFAVAVAIGATLYERLA